eukprot:15481800-Alexandrium_andersonii.AAC.1
MESQRVQIRAVRGKCLEYMDKVYDLSVQASKVRKEKEVAVQDAAKTRGELEDLQRSHKKKVHVVASAAWFLRPSASCGSRGG